MIRGCQLAAPGRAEKMGSAMSMARPIEPTVGDEFERGARLVVKDRSTERLECRKDGRQLAIHPFGGLGAGDACHANCAIIGEALEIFVGGWGEQEDGRQSAEAQDLHHRGRAGEVVAVECKQEALRQSLSGGQLPASNAAASEGCDKAWVATGMPACAASQASRNAATPPAGPSGCAMMPPPAA